MSSIVCSPKHYQAELFKTTAHDDAMQPRLFKIIDLNWETGEGDIYTWELLAMDGEPFYFLPGQFNMLYMHGEGEVPISISSDSESGKLIHTTRAVGGVTKGMQTLKKGDVIGLRGPFGSAWPIDQAKGKDLVILCGGVGLPPLRPVLYYARKHRKEFKKVYLLYGTRTPLDIVYRVELEKWHREQDIEILLTVDKQSGHWDGHIGVVPSLLSQISIDADNCLAMICGPEVMMHFSTLALNKIGVGNEQIYISMERNMKCAIGHCGHCQWGPHFICKEGPVFRFDQIKQFFKIQEL